MRLAVALSVRPSRHEVGRAVACVGPSAPIKNRSVPPARFEIPGPRDQNGSQRTRIEACHASIDSALPIRQHDPGDKYAAASDGFFSTASRKRAVPVGCQRLHQSEDDGLPNAIRQTIKNSLRIGQTISASNNANATKCSTATYFPISTFSNKVRAQNKSSTRKVGQAEVGDARWRLCRKFRQPAKVMPFHDYRRDIGRANLLS